MKLCRSCQTEKPASEFFARNDRAGGIASRCKECSQAAVKKWREENRLRYRALVRSGGRAYHARNRTDPEFIRRNREACAKRSDVIRRATPKWANKFFMWEAKELAKLRTLVMGFKWSVDHIVPLVSDIVCGLHCEQNLQVIPLVKNAEKGNHSWPGRP